MMKNKRIENEFGHSEGEGLYRADFEHSSCGIGFVANLKGKKKPFYHYRCVGYARLHGTPWWNRI